MSIVKKSILAATLAATALATTSPAMARDYYYRGHDNTAAIAIGAGVVGLALGAIIASDHDRDRYRERYYDRGYAYAPGYGNDWYYRDGWYWDRDGRRHDRDEYYRYRDGGDWRRGYDHDHGEWRRGY